MTRSMHFDRWTTTKAALSVAGALAIAGAIGSAVAMSPIVQPPIKWQGGAEFLIGNIDPGVVTKLYSAPVGKNLMLSDLIVSNSDAAPGYFAIYSGDATCGTLIFKLSIVFVPPKDSKVIAFGTGVGFPSGKSVCFEGTDAKFHVNGRGFLFTPAPAS